MKEEEHNNLTLEDIEKVVNDMFNDTLIDGVSERNIVMYQGCKTHGAVLRSSTDLNICGDPSCMSCSMMDEMLKEEFKK